MLCSSESARSVRSRHPSLTAWPASSLTSTSSRAAHSARSLQALESSAASGAANVASDRGPDTCRHRRRGAPEARRARSTEVVYGTPGRRRVAVLTMCTHVGEAAVERDEESVVASRRREQLVIGRSGELSLLTLSASCPSCASHCWARTRNYLDVGAAQKALAATSSRPPPRMLFMHEPIFSGVRKWRLRITRSARPG